MSEIEKSQQFVSDKYDQVSGVVKGNKETLSSIESDINSLKRENEALKYKNASLADDVIDLKCRSMRDNLLFFGITEVTNSAPITEPSGLSERPMIVSENCEDTVLDFCENVLNIDNPDRHIAIDRAHRIGRYNRGKIRPIVAKFKDTKSKTLIQSALKSIDLKNTDYNVSEQYPQEVKERRKALIPIMLQARREDKKAVLVRDKLYINNTLYTPAPAASGPLPAYIPGVTVCAPGSYTLGATAGGLSSSYTPGVTAGVSSYTPGVTVGAPSHTPGVTAGAPLHTLGASAGGSSLN